VRVMRTSPPAGAATARWRKNRRRRTRRSHERGADGHLRA
jgi:hypothetical protein